MKEWFRDSDGVCVRIKVPMDFPYYTDGPERLARTYVLKCLGNKKISCYEWMDS